MLKKTEDVSVPTSKGLNTIYNILALEKDQSPNMMDVIVNYDGSVEERLGTNTQNAVIIANSASSGFSPSSGATLPTNLKSFWNLNEASGSRSDIFGSNLLTDRNGTSFSSGIKNQAALFAASSSQALFNLVPSGLSGNGNFSVSAWIYLNSTSPTLQRTIVSKRDQSAGSFTNLLCHCDGTQASTTFTDNSLNALAITAVGSAQVETSVKKFGTGSVKLNGSTDWLSVANSNVFNFGTGDFTIEFFVNFNNIDNAVYGFCYSNGSETDWIEFYANGTTSGATLEARIQGSGTLAWAHGGFNSGQWYHIALVRQSGNVSCYKDGVAIGITQSQTNSVSLANALLIGRAFNAAAPMNGYMDEVRISNIAVYTAGFTPPNAAFTNPSNISGFEYWLYIDTDNKAVFDVSSSGLTANGSIRANSYGALLVGSWYNVVGWLNSAGTQIGVSVNLATNSGSYTNGIFSGTAPFALAAINSGDSMFMDGRMDETGYWNKVLTTQERSDLYNSGSGNTYQASFDTQPWASFDFGASSIRWLTVAAGTGLYASSNLGVTFVNIATDRTANYQYLDRSKNVLIATSDSYDTSLYWSGSSGTFAASLNSNATACKFSINFQGFLILLNSNSRKRGFFFEDENTQLTGTWANSFDIPSSQDDEITAVFVLRRYLYVSTRYKLFRVSYTGGNPVWSFIEIKNWGFIPRTVRKIVLTNQTPGVGLYYSIGEIAIGLTWDRKIRVFDGSNDQIISNPVEQDNGQCEFAINKISYEGSGPVISFAEVNPNQNVYHLCVSIGANSSKTTHFLNYDGRAFAFYPWSNMPYNTMCMAESANQRYLMAFDRSGKCHMMNSGNLDANTTLINGVIDTPIVFNKTPSQSTKSHKIDLFFSNTTAGGLIYLDRIDGSNVYSQRRAFVIAGSNPKLIHHEPIDVPEMFNMYQGRITNNSSMNNATFQPWRLLRYDLFMAGMGIGKND